jgi:hypothetical protein
MGFDEERSDRWRDSSGPENGKRMLLQAAIEAGAVLTGVFEGDEIPYDGARFHAEELQAEGFLKKHELQPVEDVTIWVATTPGER